MVEFYLSIPEYLVVQVGKNLSVPDLAYAGEIVLHRSKLCLLQAVSWHVV